MKALSIQQPWAWCIVAGHKDVENRTWRFPSSMRGHWIYVHAGKRFDYHGAQWIRTHFPEIVLPAQYDLGGLVGMARLGACVTESKSRWFAGPFGFTITGARSIDFVSLRGQLGFFEVDSVHARLL